MTQAALNAWSIVVLWMVIFNALLIIYNAMQIYHNRKSIQIRERDEKINNLEQDLKASRATITRMLDKYTTANKETKHEIDNSRN